MTIGRSCEHMEALVLDDAGRTVTAPGEDGTLWCAGGNLMASDWVDPVRTASTLRPNPSRPDEVVYCTGDRVSDRRALLEGWTAAAPPSGPGKDA